jgi:hypothetical protein
MSSILKKSLAVLVGSCTGFFAYWTLITYLERRKYRHIPGPPTKGILGFYFGHASELIENEKQKKMFYEMMLTW